jgi:TolB-like protein/tetratricopeptide (TPR) repeat protein
MVPLIHLFSELKRRRIYPVVVAYTLASWLLLQVGEVIFSPLGFPDWVMTALVISVIAGFPVVMLLAWVFDVHVTPTCDALPAPPEVAEDTPSVAVLPFLDMSAEQDQAYLCEGLAEEIINALTPIPGLHVAARMSSFQYRDRGGDVREIGRQLGVKAVLEGSVRKTGDRLRVTVQLVKVTNGYHLWSRSFDENLVDLFALQQQIASGIVEAMLVTLTPVKISCCTDVTAYDYYLRGRQFFNRFRKLDMEHAREMFREAMEIDPGFAPAWAGYADCHSFLVMYADPRPCYRDEANRASIKALELDPDSAEAHASRGLAYLVNESFESAESEFKQALALNPSLFQAYYYFGRARFHQGDMASAADLFKKASEVNPADYQSRLLRVQILRGSGDIDLAKAEARQAIYAVEKYLAWNPDDARALHLSAGSLILLGDLDRAERWLQRAIEIDPNDSVVLYNVACNYAVLGRTKEALNYLEQAIRHGTVSTSWLRNDADLKNICDLPRFKELLQELESRDKSGCASQIGDSVLPN